MAHDLRDKHLRSVDRAQRLLLLTLCLGRSGSLEVGKEHNSCYHDGYQVTLEVGAALAQLGIKIG
jgi:hypothetical protein